MKLIEAINKLESKVGRKVIKYARLDNGFLLITKGNPKLLQNSMFIVYDDGRMDITIPPLVDYDNLEIKTI